MTRRSAMPERYRRADQNTGHTDDIEMVRVVHALVQGRD